MIDKLEIGQNVFDTLRKCATIAHQAYQKYDFDENIYSADKPQSRLDA
jgi:hypothetical protein